METITTQREEKTSSDKQLQVATWKEAEAHVSVLTKLMLNLRLVILAGFGRAS
jgi:hypothetical protein